MRRMITGIIAISAIFSCSLYAYDSTTYGGNSQYYNSQNKNYSNNYGGNSQYYNSQSKNYSNNYGGNDRNYNSQDNKKSEIYGDKNS